MASGATSSVHTFAGSGGAKTIVAGGTASYSINGNEYQADFDSSDATTWAALGAKVVAGEDSVTAASFASDALTLTIAAGTEAGIAKILTVGGIGSDGVDTAVKAEAAITSIDAALKEVTDYRGQLGAIGNRLSHTVENLMTRSENTSSAQSRIQDTDFAVESANLAKAQVLQQAGTAMLAQANQSGQAVLSLLK